MKKMTVSSRPGQTDAFYAVLRDLPPLSESKCVTNIGNSAFFDCTKLTSVVIPDNVTSIGEEAFESCYSLASVTIGNSVTNLGDYAFAWCGSLASFAIPDSVTSIGYAAFAYCESLSNVNIPASVVSMGEIPFVDCSNVTAITVDTNNPAYSSVAGVLFNKDQTVLLEYPPGKTGCYAIPDGVTDIEYGAFGDCHSLTSVAIPDSVSRIGEFGFYGCESLTSVTIPRNVTNMGEYAFAECISLREIYFAGNAPSFGGDVFDSDYAIVYYLPGTAGWAAFDAASGLSPAVLWNAQVQTGDASFGMQPDHFGFTITGTTNIPIVVEACTNLVSGAWTPLQTCTVTNGSIYFCDEQATNQPARFYRVRWP